MEEKADSELVRLQNRRNVIAALRSNGRVARIELGKLTGLSPASMTTISAQLIQEGVIEELDESASAAGEVKRGRPTVKLGLRSQAAHVIAVKVSIDGIEFALANYRGETLATKNLFVPTYQSEQHEFGGKVARELRDFISDAGLQARDIVRIGFAVQGLPDMRNGSIDWSPAFREQNIPLAVPVQEMLGITCVVANDANMIAEGLVALDREKYGGNVAAVFVGYGVGMGLIIDGAVHHGSSGMAAEFGHMNHIPHGATCRCGKRGCLEAYVADYSILRDANQEDINQPPPMSSVAAEKMNGLLLRAKSGEKNARDAYARAGEALGFGIARLIALLNPETVVIAGPGALAREFLEPAMRKAVSDGVVETLARNVQISFVALGHDMIIRGTLEAMLRAVDRETMSVGATFSVVA